MNEQLSPKWTRMSFPNWIKKEDCKEGYVYRLYARNFKIGIFHEGKFWGIRHKFGSEFIDKEIHWDDNGSAKPSEEIVHCPYHPVNDYKECKQFLKDIENSKG